MLTNYKKLLNFYDNFFLLFAMLLIVYWAYCLISIYQFMPLGVDSGYHLSIVERIRDSSPLFTEIPVHYTPLAYFLWALVVLILDPLQITGTDIYWWTNSLMHMLTGVFAYSILRAIEIQRGLSAFTCASMLFSLSYSEGILPFLEPFVVCFSLVAVLLVIKPHDGAYRYILAGVFSAASFLSKQYGIVCLIIIVLCTYLYSKNYKLLIVHFLYAIGGFAFFTCIFLAFIQFKYQVHLTALYVQFFPKYAGQQIDFVWIMLSMWHAAPFGLLMLYWPISVRLASRDMKIFLIILFSAVIAFSMPLIKRPYLHYFLLVWPFVVLLVSVQMQIAFKRVVRGNLSSILFFILGIVLFLKMPVLFLYEPAVSVKRYSQSELATAYLLRGCVYDAKSKVLVIGNPLLMYLCNYLPSETMDTGYAFFEFISDEDLLDKITKSSRIIIDFSAYRTGEVLRRLGMSVDEFKGNLFEKGLRVVNVPGTHIEAWTSANEM